MTLTVSAPAIGPGNTASFQAAGGTAPYTYAIVTAGAGGAVEASGDDAGVYTGPLAAPTKGVGKDVVEATDSLGATARCSIMVGLPLFLLCDILQREMELDNGQVYLWDQKINIPTDEKLYIAVAVTSVKPFGNSTAYVPGAGLDAVQSLNCMAKIDISILSRGPSARDRKEEVLLAFNSLYGQQQQVSNSFSIGLVSTGFINLSEVDGAAIPYRYVISVNMQYVFKKVKAAQYFSEFEDAEVTTEP